MVAAGEFVLPAYPQSRYAAPPHTMAFAVALVLLARLVTFAVATQVPDSVEFVRLEQVWNQAHVHANV